MYITTKTIKHYVVTDQSIGPGEVRYTLQEAPAELGATVKLYADDDTQMREDTVVDYPYPHIDGNTVILSNMPAPEPVEPTPVDTKPTVEDDLLETVVDHEVRIANLELGVTG